MFTGIVQATGMLAQIEPSGGDLRLAIDAPAAGCAHRCDAAGAGREHRGQRRLPHRDRLRRQPVRGRRIARDAAAHHARQLLAGVSGESRGRAAGWAIRWVGT